MGEGEVGERLDKEGSDRIRVGKKQHVLKGVH